MLGVIECKGRPVGTRGPKAKLCNQRGGTFKEFLVYSVHTTCSDVLISSHKRLARGSDGLWMIKNDFSVFASSQLSHSCS